MYLEKTLIKKGVCTTVFIAALCGIAKTWRKRKYLSTDE